MGTARSRPFPDCAQEPPAFWPLWRPLVGPVGSPPHARSPGRRRRRRPVGRVCCPGSFQPPTSSWEAGETIRWHEAQMSTRRLKPMPRSMAAFTNSSNVKTISFYMFSVFSWRLVRGWRICFPLAGGGGLTHRPGCACCWRQEAGSSPPRLSAGLPECAHHALAGFPRAPRALRDKGRAWSFLY